MGKVALFALWNPYFLAGATNFASEFGFVGGEICQPSLLASVIFLIVFHCFSIEVSRLSLRNALNNHQSFNFLSSFCVFWCFYLYIYNQPYYINSGISCVLTIYLSPATICVACCYRFFLCIYVVCLCLTVTLVVQCVWAQTTPPIHVYNIRKLDSIQSVKIVNTPGSVIGLPLCVPFPPLSV